MQAFHNDPAIKARAAAWAEAEAAKYDYFADELLCILSESNK